MSLYLSQHGLSLPKDKDPDQGLSEEGIAVIKRIADVAKGYSVNVTGIKHSGKKRAIQTAEIFASELKPVDGIETWSGLKPLDEVTMISEKINPYDNIMLVGHLPFMERLTSFLITGSTEPAVFKFQNGGIVCLDKESGARSWIIKWTLMPNIG